MSLNPLVEYYSIPQFAMRVQGVGIIDLHEPHEKKSKVRGIEMSTEDNRTK